MTLIQEIDYGTPASPRRDAGHPDHRRQRGHRPGRHLVMRAAMAAGTEIPKLCATDSLEAFGSCRLCLVEIEGRAARRPPAPRRSPTGMVVHTQTAELAAAAPRGDGALHLRPPARLPDLPGQRRLRAAGHGRRGRPARGPLRLRRRQPRLAEAGRENPLHGHGRRNPYFTFDPAKCIVCSRCVRACEEVQGTFALTIEGRGFESRVVGRHGRGLPRLANASPAAPACRPARPPR